MTATKTVIFDMDDTLIRTGHVFFEARHKIFDMLVDRTPLTEDKRAAFLAVYDLVESKNVREKGFQKDRFPLSAGETYEVFAIAHGLVPEPQIRSRAEELAWTVFEADCPTVDAAQGVLDSLDRQGVQLVLCTKGDEAVQAHRLKQSGLSDWFAGRVEIRSDKTPEVFAELKLKYGLEREHTFVVGDSLKSDILPATANGLQAIHVPSTGTWNYFEKAEVTEPYFTANDLTSALQIIKETWKLA